MIHSRVRAPRPHRRGTWCLPIAGLILALATAVDAVPAFGPKEYAVKPTLPLPAIERFPACQPEKGGQLRVENGPNGRARVTLAVLVLNQRETVVLLEGPGQLRVREARPSRRRQRPVAAAGSAVFIRSPGSVLVISPGIHLETRPGRYGLTRGSSSA